MYVRNAENANINDSHLLRLILIGIFLFVGKTILIELFLLMTAKLLHFFFKC